MAAMRGTHESYLSEEAIAHFAAKEKAKVAANQSPLVWYDQIKDKKPE